METGEKQHRPCKASLSKSNGIEKNSGLFLYGRNLLKQISEFVPCTINELHRSTYQRTPSGKPKQSLGSVRSCCTIFRPSVFGKRRAKNSTTGKEEAYVYIL